MSDCEKMKISKEIYKLNKESKNIKKIIKHGGGFFENDNEIFYQCPSCLHYIDNINIFHNKCEYCGQLLKE